jgi:hypothetical protein
MIPRRELTELLRTRLLDFIPPKVTEKLINDILLLEEEWEEINVEHREMGYSTSINCSEICWLASQVEQGATFKIYRKKRPHAQPSGK